MDLPRIIELTVVGVIFFFGVICNCIVIRSINLARSLRGTIPYNMKKDCANLLVMNLAVADLLILIVSVPMDIIPEHISWPYGTIVCKLISPIQDICFTTSALTFGAIAVERYLLARGVTHNGTRNAKFIIAGIWLAAWLTMGLPMALYKQLITDEGRTECDIIWPNKYVAYFFLYYMIILIAVCAITGACAYYGIRRSLAKVQLIRDKQNAEEILDRANQETLAEQVLRISNLICVLITVFVICVFPFPLFVVLLESGVLETDFQYNYALYLATSCLLYGNCLANPMILMFMSKDARTALIERGSSTRVSRCNAAKENIRLEDV